jgi:hypothetical protein
MNDRNGARKYTYITLDGVTIFHLQSCNNKVFAVSTMTFKIQKFPKASNKQNKYTLVTTICLTPLIQHLLQI